MIEPVADLPPGTLGFRASGKVTGDEFRTMMEPVYAALERGDVLSVYLELADDFDRLDAGALLQDLKAAGTVGLKHRASWRRMALVTGDGWVRRRVRAFGWMAPGELRLFKPSARDQARAWVAGSASS
jgi:SpoIIAA-like